MFLLINIYESETTSAYVANVNQFESFDAAQKEMQKCFNAHIGITIKHGKMTTKTRIVNHT